MGWQEPTSPYHKRYHLSIGWKPYRVLPAPQVTDPGTRNQLRIFTWEVGRKFSVENLWTQESLKFWWLLYFMINWYWSMMMGFDDNGALTTMELWWQGYNDNRAWMQRGFVNKIGVQRQYGYDDDGAAGTVLLRRGFDDNGNDCNNSTATTVQQRWYCDDGTATTVLQWQCYDDGTTTTVLRRRCYDDGNLTMGIQWQCCDDGASTTTGVDDDRASTAGLQ